MTAVNLDGRISGPCGNEVKESVILMNMERISMMSPR
jgi:hypothetical protein